MVGCMLLGGHKHLFCKKIRDKEVSLVSLVSFYVYSATSCKFLFSIYVYTPCCARKHFKVGNLITFCFWVPIYFQQNEKLGTNAWLSNSNIVSKTNAIV